MDSLDKIPFAEAYDLIKMQFTDLFGQSKMVEMTKSQAERTLKEGYAVNRFALGGLKREGSGGSPYPALERLKEENEGRELYLKPDLETCQYLPWDSGQDNVARIICDVCSQDGTPFWADSRHVLKEMIKKAEELGLKIEFNYQCEFYLFHTDEEGHPTTITHEVAGYYDAGLIDLAESVRSDIMLTLREANMEVESAHHGMTSGQHSFLLPLKYGVEAGDYLQTFKAAVKRIAKRHGLHATFMPKPNGNGDGSGLHIGVVIRDENGYADQKVVRQFRAGILRHLRDMLIFTNPMVNSYKRLAAERTTIFQPEFPAAAWEEKHDKAVRLVEKAEHTSLQVLFPDPSANPYLALAAILSAGLDGVMNRLTATPEEENPTFPETLGILVNELEQNRFALHTFGEKLCATYMEGKRDEWDRFCSQVTDWEQKEYLYRC